MTGLRYEICVSDLDGVRAALSVGADRIELCTDLEVGGVTPPAELLAEAVDLAAGRLAVHVLIRPRAGDFVYSDHELAVALASIDDAARAGADGVVVGALRRDGAVDVATCRRFVEAAGPLSVTFHRAFDAASSLYRALEDVVSLGVDRLLTSGGAPTAPLGAAAIARLVDQADSRLVILPGGGITADNAADLVARTGVTELHFSGQAPTADGADLATRLARTMAATA